MNKPILQLKNISKRFSTGGEDIDILKSVNLELQAGQMLSLMGASGSGKSTLLHIAGLLDNADSGEVFIAGEPTSQFKDNEKTRLRGNLIGFVFQLHHLWSEFSALENIIITQRLNGVSKRDATHYAQTLLQEVGLESRGSHFPAQLSGGERQRIAIARALANKPKILLADEPTGNLDSDNATRIFDLFKKLVDKYKLAVLIATHDVKIASASDKIIKLET